MKYILLGEMLYETQSVVRGKISFNFYGKQIEFITKIFVC